MWIRHKQSALSCWTSNDSLTSIRHWWLPNASGFDQYLAMWLATQWSRNHCSPLPTLFLPPLLQPAGVSFLRIHTIGSHGKRRERRRNGGRGEEMSFPPFSFRNAFLSHCWPLLTSVPPRPEPLPPRSNLSATLNRCPNNSLSVAGVEEGGANQRRRPFSCLGLITIQLRRSDTYD